MLVEILKNVGGVSFFPTAVHENLEGFNLRKYTAIHAPAAATPAPAPAEEEEEEEEDEDEEEEEE